MDCAVLKHRQPVTPDQTSMKKLLFTAILLSAGSLGLAGCRTMPEPLKLEPVSATAVTARAKIQGLVPVSAFDSTILTDLRYATPDNAFKKVLYPAGFPALLSENSARMLAAANRQLRRQGLCLVVLDAWRPPEVQWQLFQMFRDPTYVADPRKSWSKHCYGRAVDVTLADLSGRQLPMPSAFDDFSSKASAVYAGTDPAIRRRLAQLQGAMTAAGFKIYQDEWWHFSDLGHPDVFKNPPPSGKQLGLAVGF